MAGGRVTVYARSAPERAFPLRVTEFVPPQRMVWAGGMPLGLFTGTRSFVLTAGQSYQVADSAEPHRSRTSTGAKLFIVD
jgi:hypothetical protein